MSLFDALMQSSELRDSGISTEFDSRVAEAIGFTAAKLNQAQNSVAAGFLLEGSQASTVNAPRSYVLPGLPPQTQLQMGQGMLATSSVSNDKWRKMIGILFCMPSTKVGKEEIVPHLDYFHHRSGQAFNLFCPGYIPVSRITSTTNPPSLVSVAGSPWHFDAAEYDRLRSQLEQSTNWQYSGETDLILLEVVGDSSSIRLNFASTIACNLEQMQRDEAITSIRAFVEQLVRFGEKNEHENILWRLSDNFGIKVGGQFLINAVLEILPETVRSAYKSSRHFVIRDVSKI